MNKISVILKSLAVCAFIFIGASFAMAQEKPEIFVQLGHTDTVNIVAFSPRGDLLLSTSTGKVEKAVVIGSIVKIWDVNTGRELKSFVPETDSASSPEFADFSPDGSKIVVIHHNDLAVIDISTGKQRAIKGLRDKGIMLIITAAIFSDNRTVSILHDEKILDIFDIDSGAKLSTVKSGDWAHYLRLSPGSKYYVNYGDYPYNTAWVSDLASGQTFPVGKVK